MPTTLGLMGGAASPAQHVRQVSHVLGAVISPWPVLRENLVIVEPQSAVPVLQGHILAQALPLAQAALLANSLALKPQAAVPVLQGHILAQALPLAQAALLGAFLARALPLAQAAMLANSLALGLQPVLCARQDPLLLALGLHPAPPALRAYIIQTRGAPLPAWLAPQGGAAVLEREFAALRGTGVPQAPRHAVPVPRASLAPRRALPPPRRAPSAQTIFGPSLDRQAAT